MLALPLLLTTGCLHRILRVETVPPGARIYLDGKMIGDSPVEVPFYFFGTREVMAEKDGYGRSSMLANIEGSWYEGFPFDFITDFLPIPRTDLRTVSLRLRPAPRNLSSEPDPAKEAAAAEALMQRAKVMREWSPLSR